MTYAIAGVSGNTGKVAAEALLAQGHAVRVIVRDAAKGTPWAARGAQVAVADLEDTAALTRALEGVKGAYLLVPPLFAPGYRAHQERVTASLAAAVTAARVPHVVLLSSVGAQHPAGTGPIAGLHTTEAALGSIPGTALTAIRAAYFLENLGGSLGQLEQGVLPSFFPASLKFPVIATADIGRLAAAELVEGPRGRRVVELAAPEHSNADFAAILSRITGREIVVQEAPVGIAAQVLQGFGFPPDLAALYQEMMTAIISGHVAFEGTHPRVVGTTTAETVLRGLLGR